MGAAPLELDPLRPPGAVMVQRAGLPVVGHYGSVAAEIAVSTKAAGLIDRSSMRQLALTGPATLLEHALAAAVPDGVPRPGSALTIAGTWCCRSTQRRAIVAGSPGAVSRWKQVASRAIASAGLAVEAELLPNAAALTLVGPRAARILAAAGLPADLPVNGVADVTLAGAPLLLVREDGDNFLLLFEQGHPPAVWQTLWEAGRDHGLAPVGNEALELLQAAHRPL
jgi:glycine cleavage system aminomethyltransferase T